MLRLTTLTRNVMMTRTTTTTLRPCVTVLAARMTTTSPPKTPSNGSSAAFASIKATPAVEKIVEEIIKLNLLEVAALVELLKDKLGLPDPMMFAQAAPASASAAPQAGGASTPAAAGATTQAGTAAAAAPPAAAAKTSFDVKLDGFEAADKIKLIKEVRALTGLGLKEAKEAVEGAPKVLGTGLSKADAEAMMEKLKAAGGRVTLV